MPAYLVQVASEVTGTYLLGGADSHVVFAADAAGAREAVAARYGGDVNSAWNDSNLAEVTELVADADLEDWTFKITLYDTTNRLPAEEVSVTGGAADALDDIGAALVTALNALDDIAGAAYDTATNVLTVAETTDGIGDWTFVAEAIPPWGETSIDSLFSSQTDGGASGDALTLTFVADGPTLPFHYAALRTR